MHKPVKKNILIIILIVIVLGLGGLSFLVYNYAFEKDTLTPISISTKKSDSKTSTTTGSTTSNTSTTPATTSTTNSSDKMIVKIFMIEMNDNGKSGKLVGCGDSAIAVLREVPQTQAVLQVAIEQLLSVKNKDYGQSGYYNALYQSNLALDSAEISSNKAIIKLSGTVLTSGTCDNPRLIAQLEETAKQFPAVKEVEILVNNKNLKSILSEEG